MKIISFLLVCLSLAALYSCGNEPAPGNGMHKSAADSAATSKNCSTETIKDPNNPKPMAIMMRMMAANMDSMRSILSRGETIKMDKFPFLRFYLAEPTDTNVLEPKFFENARLFQNAYTELSKHPDDQQKYFNLVIGKCVNCHESYCNGPLKRIRKFYIGF